MVADAPFRLEPGCDLPVLLLIKDAQKYPIFLTSVSIELKSTSDFSLHRFDINETVNTAWWKKIFMLNIPEDWRGQTLSADVKIEFAIKGKQKTIHNDNFKGLSHDALKVNIAQEPRPVFDRWHCGDLHFHTDYTSDQVEFGAPIEAALKMARALGLSFFAATDHSYDLDDDENDYLKNDPDLKKWKRSRLEIKSLNEAHVDPVVIIPGEEVSCANDEGRNVHCLVLNHDDFVPGSGDSAEKWLRTDSELTIESLARKASSRNLLIAAHPKDTVPLLERILIRRGMWMDNDCRTKGITGLQILNGLDNDAFRKGLQQWIKQLLDGERVCIFAGNDAHGNFNRYRQIKTPMLSLQEIENHQLFGWATTAVWMDRDRLNVENILKHLGQGHAVITNGPLLIFTVLNDEDNRFQIGESVNGRSKKIELHGKTTNEFGQFTEVKIIAGQGERSEVVLKTYQPSVNLFESEIDPGPERYAYFRCEALTSKGFFCYTNPIWLYSP